MNDGITMPLELNLESSETATLAVGARPPEKMVDMQWEGAAFIGNTTGTIESPDALRLGAKTLLLKVIPRDGRLEGRIAALAGPLSDPHGVLPYVVSLSR